jgi:hypothetical protein
MAKTFLPMEAWVNSLGVTGWVCFILGHANFQLMMHVIFKGAGHETSRRRSF